MKGYSAREIAAMLDVSTAQVRAYANAGLLQPVREENGELSYSFQDLVILRAAKELTDANIAPRKVSRALRKLREQLPKGRPLTAVRISAEGARVVVRDGESLWQPESGQALFDFAVSDLEARVAPFVRKFAADARSDDAALTADEWYELGWDVEIGAPEEAEAAYRKAIELDPDHSDAMVNLGRLLQERGALEEAANFYRDAIVVEPDYATAFFNLGVVMEEMGDTDAAIAAYEDSIRVDPTSADSHYNLAGLHESLGRKTLAYRHLKAYKELVDRHG
jgi:tetratricopeptide (TPR) repeat protein